FQAERPNQPRIEDFAAFSSSSGSGSSPGSSGSGGSAITGGSGAFAGSGRGRASSGTSRMSSEGLVVTDRGATGAETVTGAGTGATTGAGVGSAKPCSTTCSRIGPAGATGGSFHSKASNRPVTGEAGSQRSEI